MSVSRRPDIAQAIGHLQHAGREPWLAHRRAHFERMLGRILERYALELDALFEEIAGGRAAGVTSDSFAVRCDWSNSSRIEDKRFEIHGRQSSACKPFRSSRFSSLTEGPLGRF